MGVISVILYVEQSPPLYHAYIAMTVFLWTQILGDYQFVKALWRHLSGKKSNYAIKLLVTCAISILLLEFLVWELNMLLFVMLFTVINC